MYAEAGVDPELDPPPPDSSRWIPTPFVACRLCGHEERGGSTFIGPLDEEDGPAPKEAQELTRRFEHEHRRRQREALERIDFPVYAPDGAELALGGWGGPPGTINRVSVGGGIRSGAEVTVETSVGDAIFQYPSGRTVEAVEELLEREGHDEEWPLERSEAGLRVWLETQERKNRARRRRLMSEIEQRQTELTVGGAPQPVEYAEVDGRWSAAFDGDEVAVTVSSSEAPIEDVRLVVVDNPLGAFTSATDE
jgi:hypothetical protein